MAQSNSKELLHRDIDTLESTLGFLEDSESYTGKYGLTRILNHVGMIPLLLTTSMFLVAGQLGIAVGMFIVSSLIGIVYSWNVYRVDVKRELALYKLESYSGTSLSLFSESV